MKHLARELAEYLAGPPKIYQSHFCAKSGVTTAKLSRLLREAISCDQRTLDKILSAVPQRDSKARIVAAYFRDLASPAAIAMLKTGGTEWAELDFSRFSKRGQATLKALLNSDHVEDVEKILINLATALGV
jgi:hypothetical protein